MLLARKMPFEASGHDSQMMHHDYTSVFDKKIPSKYVANNSSSSDTTWFYYISRFSSIELKIGVKIVTAFVGGWPPWSPAYSEIILKCRFSEHNTTERPQKTI